MKVQAILLVSLLACALCAEDKTVTPDKSVESLYRKSRLFFLPNFITGSRLGQTISNLANTIAGNDNTKPNVVLVARPPQSSTTCPLPLFTRGCPAGHVCALAESGRTHCVPQYPDGFSFQTGFQCNAL